MALLDRIRHDLADAFGARLRGVVLYGSDPRGEADAESDIDVPALLEGPVRLREDIGTCVEALYPLALEPGRPIDVLPVDAAACGEGKYPVRVAAGRGGLRA